MNPSSAPSQSSQDKAPAALHEVSGTSILNFLKYFDKKGVRATMRQRVSPATAIYFDKLILRTSWVHRSVLDDIYAAVAMDGGEDAVRRFSLEVTRDGYGPMVRQFAETLLGLMGASPSTLFSRYGAIGGMYEHGTEYSYTALSPRSGELVVRLVEPAPRLVFVAWEGVFQFAFELTREQGTVAPVQVSENGRVGRYLLTW
ncbi:hypothetical protein D7V80_11255 [Corallococcus sp. CA054B]|uniref:hypothetical protein n=1 Tax=Corallococcus sp. CA054B TaxID=2316734 RepID=UPI000EA273E2|nr:hypothetical protein [Corallococcus sp. CA054B]RKG68717.1 hypothetical protein D7V80_11255 [Corallococcus sp. CA054B]